METRIQEEDNDANILSTGIHTCQLVSTPMCFSQMISRLFYAWYPSSTLSQL